MNDPIDDEMDNNEFYRAKIRPYVAEDWRRELICEGACNKHIHDYDQTVTRTASLGMRGKYCPDIVSDMVRTLVHTVHNTLDNQLRYHPLFGWGRLWKCSKCGYSRHG